MNDKIKIEMGHTNKEKYLENGNFIIIKTKNEFNHKIDYSILSKFDFVPNLIFNDDKKVIWEEIKNAKPLKNPTNEQLNKLGLMLREIHLSDLNFPKFNLRRRAKSYISKYHKTGKRVDAIEDNYKEMMLLIKRMNHINASHNDVWWQNILVDENDKLWLVDWEYATRGDKHFDLAFYIESQKLNAEQEKIFLNAYGSNDFYNAVIEEWMPKYKRFCHWLTICWAYSQPKMPFDISESIDYLEKTKTKK